jgi:imidazole glycerol-phosphate synthase subunit HisF
VNIPRVMPCLLVEDGRLVKTVKFKNPTYVGDPVNAIKIYNEKEVDELIIVDIIATKQKREPNFKLIKEIANECFMPVCYGGGISSIDEMKKLFNLGIEKVAVNSHAIDNPGLIKKAAEAFGNQSVICSMDVKKNIFGRYQVLTHNGTRNSKKTPVEYAQFVEKFGAGEILLNAIDKDGTWSGFDLELIKSVTDNVNVPVIALGGAGNSDHIAEAVKNAGASAVGLGSMAVFQGKDLGVLVNFPARKTLEHILG